MGCNSSAPASEPGSAGASNKKGLITGAEIYFEYFESMGRGDPITQMMAHAGQNCEKRVLEIPAWTTRKENGDGGEFGGGLPQVFVKKGGKTMRMAQFSAIMRSFGIRYGFYDPKDWKAARYTDPIVDCWGDEMGLLTAWAFGTPETQPAAMEAWRAQCDKFHGLVEKTLAHHGKKFIAGDKVTIGDFVLCAHLANYCMNPASPFTPEGQASAEGKPCLQKYMAHMMESFPYLKNRGAVGPA